uniref:Uncharacterized protein n=1 Tax=Arundo donax TaxID=35708 RepID=A0A0A9FB57_ARUDO
MSLVMALMTSPVDASVSKTAMSWSSIARRYASRIFAACRSPVCIQHATSVHDEKSMTTPRYTKSSEYLATRPETVVGKR